MSQRIEKINTLLKQEVGKALLSEMNFPLDVLVTIIRVNVSKDLRYADVFISVLPFEKKDETKKALKEKIYFIQKKINKKLVMKPLPRIVFKIDETGEHVQKIDELIREIHKDDK
ncbi:MAG: 30S ribosome-binding factor RbfA [Candidatus Pacebacteria bacterium]|nr:30S ribosome-binding factor RbfA [Candidatus Paceibacterota bacterium]